MRNTSPAAGAHVRVVVNGLPADTAIAGIERPTPDLEYSLIRKQARWALYRSDERAANAEVTLEGETAWRLFSKGITKEGAMARAAITGDEALAEKLFNTVAILA